MLIEIMSPDSARKAIALKDRLSEVLKNEAQVTRPIVREEIRLVGLDASTSADDVRDTVASYRGCIKENIRVGIIRPMMNGLHTVWVQCPLSAAIKTANNGKIKVSWTLARVDLLGARPTQCFKCWQFGHLKHACQSKEDFSRLCFKCGGSGHAARHCNAPSVCKICVMEGKTSNHRLGSNFCPAAQDPTKRGMTSAATRPSSAGSARGTETMNFQDGG